jgi:DHA3 family macrolide efflux protein-like MFS transporter
MVPKENLSRINGLNYLFGSFVNVIGPVVGGLLLTFLTIEIALWIDIITYFIAIVPLLLVTIPDIRDKEKKEEVELGFWEDFKKGFKVLNVIPGLLILLILATLANFFEMPLNSLLSNYIIVDNNGTELIYAIVNGSLSAGVFIGSIIVTLRKEWNNKILIIVYGIVVGNIGYLLIALSPYQFFSMMIIGGILYGFFLPIVNTMFLTIIQSKVPAENQGRVISLAITISSGITPISIILAGPLAKLFGISTIWFIYSLIGIVVCILMWFFTNLKNLDKIEQEEIKKKIAKKVKAVNTEE